MDIFKAIEERRSIRKFSDKPVSKEDLQKILSAGQMAASWSNTQCWEILIVTKDSTKMQLQDTLSDTNPATKAIVQAPIVLVACGKKKLAGCKNGITRTQLGDWLMFDVALFLSNVTLAAFALGLGTVHIGSFDHSKVAKIISIPNDLQVVELVPLGFPANTKPKKIPPRKSINEFVHYHKF